MEKKRIKVRLTENSPYSNYGYYEKGDIGYIDGYVNDNAVIILENGKFAKADLRWIEAVNEEDKNVNTELKESEDELTWLKRFIQEEIDCLSIDIRDSEDRVKLKNLQRSFSWLEKQSKESKVEQAMREVEEKAEAFTQAHKGETSEEILAQMRGEQKPVNKVKPKFKDGDWIIDIQGVAPSKIIGYEDDSYLIKTSCSQFYLPMKLTEKNYRLWTIQDAKDGDVLCCENGWTCIFKTLVNDETFSSYCFMDSTKWFCEKGSECHTLNEAFVKAYNGYIHPATKEQRDLLFTKMKEAGYTWDADKKELKKIEQNSAWSEEDETVLNNLIYALANDRIGNDRDEYVSWLKSLKDIYSWRPSSEQIKVCKEVYADVLSAKGFDLGFINSELNRMEKQLKKLREV